MAKVLKIVSFAACSQLAVAAFPAKQAGEVAAGLVEGFIGAPDVQACIKNSVTEISDLDDAIKLLEKKTAADTLKGLKLLVEAFKGLPVDLKACKASEADVEELVKAFKQFTSPKSFAYHVGKDLVVNHEDIYKEVLAAIADFHAEKWLDFGVQIGTALHKLIISVQDKFVEFEQKFGKVYSQEERQIRMKIFAKNVAQIRNVRRTEETDSSAVYSHLTPFADLSTEEFAQFNGFKPELMQQDAPVVPAELLSTTDVPTDFDWVEKGAVNPVKNQGQCGSCWAFSTVANIEGAGFVANKKLVSLSEQELVDCDKTADHGCQGGLPSNAFKALISNKLGLETEKAYPYKGANDKCQATAAEEQAFITGWKTISTDEDQIAAALIKFGPLSIGINAGPMQWYHGGVANPWKFLCNPASLDHGVAIVGFGVDGTKKYWKIRNSWGPSWGEKGYYRIIRGVGKCGLNTMVTTVTGVTLKSANTDVVVV